MQDMFWAKTITASQQLKQTYVRDGTNTKMKCGSLKDHCELATGPTYIKSSRFHTEQTRSHEWWGIFWVLIMIWNIFLFQFCTSIKFFFVIQRYFYSVCNHLCETFNMQLHHNYCAFDPHFLFKSCSWWPDAPAC